MKHSMYHLDSTVKTAGNITNVNKHCFNMKKNNGTDFYDVSGNKDFQKELSYYRNDTHKIKDARL